MPWKTFSCKCKTLLNIRPLYIHPHAPRPQHSALYSANYPDWQARCCSSHSAQHVRFNVGSDAFACAFVCAFWRFVVDVVVVVVWQLLILMRVARSLPKIKRRLIFRFSSCPPLCLPHLPISASLIISHLNMAQKFRWRFLDRTNRRRLGKSTHLYADYVPAGSSGSKRSTKKTLHESLREREREW